MRDYFFLALLPFMLYPMFKRPFIGLGMWIWTAMFFPNAWLYGIGADPATTYLHRRRDSRLPRAQAQAGVQAHRPSFAGFSSSSCGPAFPPCSAREIRKLWANSGSGLPRSCCCSYSSCWLSRKNCMSTSSCGASCFRSVSSVALKRSNSSPVAAATRLQGFTGHVLGDRNELALAFVITMPICYLPDGRVRQRPEVDSPRLAGHNGSAGRRRHRHPVTRGIYRTVGCGRIFLHQERPENPAQALASWCWRSRCPASCRRSGRRGWIPSRKPMRTLRS